MRHIRFSNTMGWACLLIPTLVVSVGCNRPSASADPTKLTLTGSSTLAPMMAEIGTRFEQAHPDVRIEVQTGGSGRGIQDAIRGAADIGMSSRCLTTDEKTSVATTIVGWDGIAFIIHADNPVTTLDHDQLRAIYTGRIKNWKDVGGDDSPIVVSNRAAGRSELELMAKFLQLQPNQISANVIDGETQQSIKTITTNVNAIGYTSVGAAQYAAEHGQSLRLLPLNGISASTATVQSGDFPLARPLVLITKSAQERAMIKAFLDFCVSPAVDDITLGLGYVPPQRDRQLSSKKNHETRNHQLRRTPL